MAAAVLSINAEEARRDSGRVSKPEGWRGHGNKNRNDMKKTPLVATIIPAALLLTGCYTTGISAREQNNNYAAMINGVYRRTPAGTANQPPVLPMELAGAQIGEVAPDTALTDELGKNSSLIQSVIALPMPGDNGVRYRYGTANNESNDADMLAAEVESARNLARDSGAKYLLIVGGTLDSFDAESVLSALDLTIVGGFVVPATQIHMQGKAAGALIDVESGRVLLMANAGREQSGGTPDFFTDQKRDEMSVEVRKQLLTKLADNVLEKLNRTPPEPAPR
jgi:hypothetical protein